MKTGSKRQVFFAENVFKRTFTTMDKLISIVFFVVLYGKLILSFNLDLREPIVMESGFSGEYFGFTVALHSHGSDNW